MSLSAVIWLTPPCGNVGTPGGSALLRQTWVDLFLSLKTLAGTKQPDIAIDTIIIVIIPAYEPMWPVFSVGPLSSPAPSVGLLVFLL